MVATQVAIDDRPSAVRFPRGEGLGIELPARGVALEIGKGRIIREGNRICLLSYGTRLSEALKAADQLDAMGYSTSVVDARFMKPLDEDLLRRLAGAHELIVSVEEGSMGGFGAHVMQFMHNDGLLDMGPKFRAFTLPDTFIDHNTPSVMYDLAALNATQIVARVMDIIQPPRAQTIDLKPVLKK